MNSELPLFHPSRAPFRIAILFFVSLLTFGSYFAYDSIGALSNVLIKALGMKQGTIGSLYSFYSIAAILIVFFGGVLTDRLGTRKASLLFSTLVLAGAVIVALAKTTWMLFLGRFVFGAGSESLVVAQLAILSKWFKGKELALSFGVSLTISRLGTLISFNTEAQIADHYHNFRYALWAAALLCLLSLLGNLIYNLMDRYGDKVLGKRAEAGSDKIVFSDIKSFPTSYWYVTLLCLTFYSAIFPFTALSTNLFAEKWKIPDVAAGSGGFLSQLGRTFAGLFNLGKLSLGQILFWLLILALVLIRLSAKGKERSRARTNLTWLVAIAMVAIILLPAFLSLIHTAPGITSIIIFASMVCAPFAGRLVDRIGHRASLMIIGCLILIPSHALIGFTRIHPLYPMVSLGVAFVLVPAALWPSITLLVPKEKVGTAFGLTTMIQNVGLMLFPLLNGKLRDLTHAYTASQLMFAALGVLGLVYALLLLRSDRRGKSVLEKP